jgi:quercetin dioxygenase-like cupin family protein
MTARALLACVVALAIVPMSLGVTRAQQPAAPAAKATPLLKAPYTADPNKEVVIVRIEWPANVSTPWHTHPGDEYATVLEGAVITQVDGAEPKTVAAGQSYHQPAGTVHMARTGNQPAITINVFVVDKDKPMMQPRAAK